MGDESGFQVGEHAPRHYQAQVQRMMAPFVRALVAAGVSEGDAVLDVACGTGFATRAASLASGASGSVVGTDLNPAMVAIAESVPHTGGAAISWRAASALELPFSDGAFDSVICQQGVQFFSDVPAGLREMTRVVRPGGRLAVTIWAPIAQCPFADARTDMLIGYCEGDTTHTAMAFAEGGERQIRSWLNAAGMAKASIELVEAIVSLPPVADYVPKYLKALPWVGKFFEVEPEIRMEALASLDTALEHYRTEAGFDLPFRSYLATAAL